MKKYENHPLADIFPQLRDHEQEDLTKDISENGLAHSIILFDGKVLDGRHRLKACIDAGIEPRFETLESDPYRYVLSANLNRRHMTVGQRAMVAAQVSNMREGNPNFTTSGIPLVEGLSQSEAAKKMKVSVDSVKGAKKILEEATKGMVKAVKDGKKTINGALKDLKKQEVKQLFDKTKVQRPIPDAVVENWNRSDEVSSQLVSLIQKVVSILREGVDSNDKIFREFSGNVVTQAEALRYTVKSHLSPHALCFTCHGIKPEKCDTCSQRGFISKYFWDSPGAKEAKAFIEKGK